VQPLQSPLHPSPRRTPTQRRGAGYPAPLDRLRLDRTGPKLNRQPSASDQAEQFEHLVGEAADVQHVLALARLGRAVRLKIDAHQPHPRAARPLRSSHDSLSETKITGLGEYISRPDGSTVAWLTVLTARALPAA
jgi:hypothetical protein